MGEPLPRLVAVTDGTIVADTRFWALLDALLDAGLPALWLRWEGADDRTLQRFSERSRERTAERGAELWIGARPDVARSVEADAVQLPEEGVSIALARRVTGGTLRVGRAVHSVAAALEAADAGADQLVIGTIYASPSHPEFAPAGPDRIRRVRETLTVNGHPLPCFAIGGIDAGNVGAVISAGADGVAAIGALWRAPDPKAVVRAMIDALDRAPLRGD